MPPPETYKSEIGSQSTTSQVHAGAYVSLFTPEETDCESELPVHDRHGCVCVSTRSDFVTAKKRNGAERMDTDWILVENVNGFRTELLDDGT